MSSLLPPNSTPLERAATEAMAEIKRVEIPLRKLWNPDTCPVEVLPYLAWAFSVDRWDSTWLEATKREVVRSSYYIHRRKGTIAALRRVVEPLGYLLEVTEWWELDPEGTPGTFQVVIGLLDSGITDQMFTELERLLDDAKPVSRHLTGLDIYGETRGTGYVGAGTYTGEISTVYPYLATDAEVSGFLYFGVADHTIDTASVYPQ